MRARQLSALPQLKHARSGAACLLLEDGQMEGHFQFGVTVRKDCVIQLWQGEQARRLCPCLSITCLLRLVSTGRPDASGTNE